MPTYRRKIAPTLKEHMYGPSQKKRRDVHGYKMASKYAQVIFVSALYDSHGYH